MLSVTHYAVLWCILFMLLGAVWYNLDRAFGVRIYRRWYNLTHKHPLPDGEVRGFVFNRSTKARVGAAWVVSTVQSLIVIFSGEVNLLVEFILWIFEVPITMIGFYLGPFTYRLWGRRDDVFGAMDRLERKVESGELDLTRSAQTVGVGVARKVRSVVDSVRDATHDDNDEPDEDRETVDATAPPVHSRDVTDEPDDPDVDGRQLMRNYAKRRQGRDGNNTDE